MRDRVITAPIWFIAALVPLAISQIARLHQTDPLAWIIYDYAGRIGAILVLAAIPAAREVAFARHRLKITRWELTLWVASLVLFDRIGGTLIRAFVAAMPVGGSLGDYPALSGWIFALDTSVGLALVAYTEETMFRRCARHVFRRSLGEGRAMVIVTSIIFAAYHWWSGVGNVVAVAFYGGLAMLFYRRSGSLWPVVLGHYLTDLIAFL